VRGKGKVGKLPLLDFLKKDYPGIKAVHRIDFETSGVVVFAKNTEVERKILSNKFDQWTKTYVALVMGRIHRNSGAIRKKLPARSKGFVDAQTLYTVQDVFANSTLVECVITTGRHHQIRRHFAGIDHPLVLDKEYGHGKFNQLFRQELGFSKFFLHASKISFPHPMTGKTVCIEAPMPKPFSACVKKLRSL
jgi:23S rRNA-/tRNA-specific pseudouridylate synthase